MGELSYCQFSEKKFSEKAQCSETMDEMDGSTLYLMVGLTLLRDIKISSFFSDFLHCLDCRDEVVLLLTTLLTKVQ